jgi:glycosyltransferase involved in cell wall biosynthesis
MDIRTMTRKTGQAMCHLNPDNAKILVVIPAYNEESSIYRVVRSANAMLPGSEILVIDDSSADNTKSEAKKAGAIVLSHPLNLGYASSLELGYIYALQHGYDIVLQMDGDGQHLAEEMPKVLFPVARGEADICIGSRYMLAEQTYKTSWVRRTGQKFFGLIYSLITKEHITDPTSGFQCLNKKAFHLFAEGHFPDDFPDTDVLLISHYARLVIREVPVRMHARSDGESMHSGFKPLYYIVKMLLSIFMVILNHRRWRTYAS